MKCFLNDIAIERKNVKTAAIAGRVRGTAVKFAAAIFCDIKLKRYQLLKGENNITQKRYPGMTSRK